MTVETPYEFPGGFPTADTITAAYDAADYARAVTCYKHFFPAVSGMTILVELKQSESFRTVPSGRWTPGRGRSGSP